MTEVTETAASSGGDRRRAGAGRARLAPASLVVLAAIVVVLALPGVVEGSGVHPSRSAALATTGRLPRSIGAADTGNARPAAPITAENADRVQVIGHIEYTGRHSSIAFTPDGETLATGSADQAIRFWRVPDGVLTQALTGHGEVSDIAFTPDGQTLAFTAGNGTVRVTRASDGAQLLSWKPHDLGVRSMTLSPDGTMLATGEGVTSHHGRVQTDTSVRLWRVSDGALLRTFQGEHRPIRDLAFSPDGQSLAASAWAGGVTLWQISTGRIVRTFDGEWEAAENLAFSPDGQALTASADGRVIPLWRVSDGTRFKTIDARPGVVLSTAFSADGTIVATGDKGSAIHLWHAADGTLLRTLKPADASATAEIDRMAFSPGGEILVASSSDGVVWLWGASQ
ncbi:MAG TPA: WD40 repeat domain-containing protein [Chloroflexota bacterium]|nr:WD40 repeat domain-containing protein [Chloroflexota bacterium]